MVMSLQLQADHILLEYQTYEDYLDSLVTCQDLQLLRSTKVAQFLAMLGYRSSGETLDRESFHRRLTKLREVLFPTVKVNILASEGFTLTEPLQQELAMRERLNRIGIIATVIFLRVITKSGFEVSGYIDYLDRLTTENWKPFFAGKKKLYPKKTDLAYYHWRCGKSYCTSSKTFKVIIEPTQGLILVCRSDRRHIRVDPYTQTQMNQNDEVVVQRIFSEKYAQITIFDKKMRSCY